MSMAAVVQPRVQRDRPFDGAKTPNRVGEELKGALEEGAAGEAILIAQVVAYDQKLVRKSPGVRRESDDALVLGDDPRARCALVVDEATKRAFVPTETLLLGEHSRRRLTKPDQL